MKIIKNGGLGNCAVLKEQGNVLLVAVLNDMTTNFAVAENYNNDYQCWYRGGYHDTLDEALKDFKYRINKN